MCGIAGLVSWGGVEGDGGIAPMVQAMRHRGPDDQGIWKSPSGACVLGHTRLSIIDLSSAAHQPMIDELTNNAVVFNGEIYNFQEVRELLVRRYGAQFKSQSDTEVLLLAYRYFGMECLDYFRGMFAFAIWDESRQRLFLARDRVGKKPLVYAKLRNGIIFSSEIAPLAQHPEVDGNIDHDALDFYFNFSTIPAPWSIYKSIRKLPPAHHAAFDRNSFSVRRYWQLYFEPKVDLNQGEALEQFDHLLREAVRLRLIADVPVGALLSGGVDSSVVVSLMSDLQLGTVRTFNVGFSAPKFDESRYATIAAGLCRTEHHPFLFDGSYVDIIDKMVSYYGEPYGDSSALPSFFICEKARESVTVILNGDGGDELLGGYSTVGNLNQASQFIGNLTSRLLSSASLAQGISYFFRGTGQLEWLVRRAFFKFIIPDVRIVKGYEEYWDDYRRKQLLPGINRNGVLTDWRESWLSDSRKQAANVIDRLLWIDMNTYLPDDLLVKMDIASMHCGLEARSPLLDHKLIEFCARLPVKLKVKNKIGKYLLKKYAERYYDYNYIYRKKSGFLVPLDLLFSGPLKPELLDLVRDNGRYIEPLNNATIRRYIDEYLQGQKDHLPKLWTVFMYYKWKNN
jgi:asparagine synthase (glutamine-hydrolysing)